MAISQIADQIGRVVGGRYRLETLCGTGSSAHVYQAFDTRLARKVAVKLLHPGLVHEPAFLKRFGAEAKSAAGLNHPNIVRVLDWGEEEAGPYLVLEYMGGGSLAQIISHQTRLTVAQACHIGVEASKALSYAHRQGLIHRDVKPANILFDEDGRAAIADFGLARALAEAAWTEPEGSIFGTARYTSPEQATGNSFEGRSDVYSLGLVLYEAVLGESPFKGESTVSVLMARVGYDIPIPEHLGEFGTVLSRMLNPIVRLRIDSSGLVDKLEDISKKLDRPEPLVVNQVKQGDPDLSSPDATIVGTTLVPESTGETTKAGLFDYEANQDSTAKKGRLGTKSRRAPSSRKSSGNKELSKQTATPGGDPTKTKGWLKVVSLICLVAILGAGGAYAYETGVFAPKVLVPQVVGMSPASASRLVVKDHLTLRVVARRFIKATQIGAIFSQSPSPHGRAPKGASVNVVVSLGPPFAQVPNVDAMSESLAAAKLGARGFNPKFAQAYSLTVPGGQVISYSPHGRGRYGQVVTLEISQGPQPETIPESIVGASPQSATSALEGLGLTVASKSENSSTVAKGLVLGTDPPVGQSVNQGSSVTILISLGPVMVQVPNVNGDSVTQATNALSAKGFNPQNVYGPPGGVVFATNPAEGTSVAQGSSVSLYTN